MGAVTVCGTSGGENYMDTLILTPGSLRNTWMIQSGHPLDFSDILDVRCQTDLNAEVDRFDEMIELFVTQIYRYCVNCPGQCGSIPVPGHGGDKV